jgi:16S rRNA (uracil1498-N3)-methyltransferase
MPRFFCVESIQQNATFALDARVAQHVRVLRLREGEVITLFDGSGGEVPATLEKIDKREVLAATAAHVAVEREATHAIALYPALIANDRMDWMIQKATELGVAAIQPIFTERSQRIPGDVEKRVEHWRGVIVAACEQCGRNRIPGVHAPITLAEAVQKRLPRSAILLDAEGDDRLTSIESSCALFIGPEGGFSQSELSALRDRCERRLRIGFTVLRAETAAIAALARLA